MDQGQQHQVDKGTRIAREIAWWLQDFENEWLAPLDEDLFECVKNMGDIVITSSRVNHESLAQD